MKYRFENRLVFQEPEFVIKEKERASNEKIRNLNKQSTTPAGNRICIILNKWSGRHSFKRRGNVSNINSIFYIALQKSASYLSISEVYISAMSD